MIKWKPFAAMPEQFAGLNDLFMEQQKIAEPYIDEQTLEQFNYIICGALEHNKDVEIVYYKSGNNLSVVGKIHHWNEIQHKIHFIDFKQKVHYIPSDAIINISMIDINQT